MQPVWKNTIRNSNEKKTVYTSKEKNNQFSSKKKKTSTSKHSPPSNVYYILSQFFI